MKRILWVGSFLALFLFLFSFLHVRHVSLRDIPSSLTRNRLILVHFWSINCGVCRSELGSLPQLFLSLRSQGVGFLSVLIGDESFLEEKRFLVKHDELFPYPVILDKEGVWSSRFGGISVVPVSFLVDQKGRILKTYLGLLDGARLRQEIRRVFQTV